MLEIMIPRFTLSIPMAVEKDGKEIYRWKLKM